MLLCMALARQLLSVTYVPYHDQPSPCCHAQVAPPTITLQHLTAPGPQVHRFVQLCRATGGSFTYRWNEQGVIAMLWQIFLKPEQFHAFEFDYKHRLVKAQDAYDMAAAPSVAEGN